MAWCVCVGGWGAVKFLYVAQEACHKLKLADLYMHLLMCMPCMLVCVCVFGDGYVCVWGGPVPLLHLLLPLGAVDEIILHLSCCLESFMRIVRL
jgi:hypothetical protein